MGRFFLRKSPLAGRQCLLKALSTHCFLVKPKPWPLWAHRLGLLLKVVAPTFCIRYHPLCYSRTLLWKLSSLSCNLQFSLSLVAYNHIIISPIFWKPSLDLVSLSSHHFISRFPFYQTCSPWTSGPLLLSGPPWSALLTSRVSPCPQLLTMGMDYFVLLETIGLWTPHSWFVSYFAWLSFWTFFAGSSDCRNF